MSDNGYFDIYLKRVNRYGEDYKTRVLNQRREVFDRRLERSVYRIDFKYTGNSYFQTETFNEKKPLEDLEKEWIPATLERYKQDETETFHYLLTAFNQIIPNGTVLFLPHDNPIYDPKETDEEKMQPEFIYKPWMVYWLEETTAKGYNRYILLKMTHFISWKDRDGKEQATWSYMYGQEDNMLKDEIRSRSRMDTIYAENLKGEFFILPVNENLQKDDYFTIGEGKLKRGFRVTGFDPDSSQGVEYVTVDPLYLYDETTIEVPEDIVTEEEDQDYFWLTGDLGGND